MEQKIDSIYKDFNSTIEEEKDLMYRTLYPAIKVNFTYNLAFLYSLYNEKAQSDALNSYRIEIEKDIKQEYIDFSNRKAYKIFNQALK